jgi:hypothetical protein
MGRPLKIAKAVMLTLTATNGTTEVVTVSENLNTLNIIAGMPFVIATTTGGLTAGTTYWILEVLTANTFTVSATETSANPSYTKVNLSTAGPVTVKMSVGVVDTGFQNPDSTAQSGNTSTNPGASYGVVGGNTTIYGSQVLAQVAIGINGTGTLYALSGNANVFGTGTDFANTTSVGSAIQVAVANTNGSTDYVDLGFIATNSGYANIEISNATATGNFLTTVGNAQLLFASKPVVLSANIGGLVAGTTYFVKTIANTTAFSVSLDAGGPNVGLSNQNATSYAVQDRIILSGAATTSYANAAFVYANDEAGYIVRQKGKQKYLVTGLTSGLTAQCTTANVANTALTPNTMSVTATTATPATVYVQSVNNYQSELFETTVAAGSISAGTAYTILSVGTTNWTAVGASANITGVSFVATATGSGTGTAILTTANPDVIATFNTAYAANTYDGQPNPIVVVNNA